MPTNQIFSGDIQVTGDLTANNKQDTLVSGTNIKTINGSSVLGSGDLVIGGGGGSTGDFTFVANTISLPQFTDAVLNVTGNVGSVSVTTLETLTYNVQYGSMPMYDIFADFNAVPKRLFIIVNGGQITDSDNFAVALATKMTAGSFLTLVGGNGTQTQSLIPVTVGLSYNPTAYNGQPAWTAEIPTLARSYLGSNLASIRVEEYQDTRVATEFAYTFSQTGEFISDSALVGDVYISDNIITPTAALNYYGLPGDAQPLIVNGDLEVIGNITANNIVSKTVRSYNSAPAGVVEYDLRVYNVLRSSGIVGNHNLDLIMPNNAWTDEVYEEYYSQFGTVIGGYIQAQYFPRQGDLPSVVRFNGVAAVMSWSGFDGASSTADGIVPTFSRTPGLITFHVVKPSQYSSAQITAIYV
jgi:hypothetical protein